jgi:hypothetical protein
MPYIHTNGKEIFNKLPLMERVAPFLPDIPDMPRLISGKPLLELDVLRGGTG